MRASLLSLIPIFTPLVRCSAHNFVSGSGPRAWSSVVVPAAIQYPVCRRGFSCSASASFRESRIGMAELGKQELENVERMDKPASSEAEILGGNEEREEALCDKMKETDLDSKPTKEEKPEAESKPEPEKKEDKKEEPAAEPPLPKLSAAEFRVYNSMAEHMNYFHNHFRQTWTTLYTACETNRRPSNLSLRQFIQTGLQFISHLTTHHSIEEAHIFPLLARKMPEFKNGRNAAELLRQHKEIHKGMEQFEEYLERCRSGETELQLSVLKTKMDCWGEVLWKHLDQEVKTLGAENMRKYWTIEEMRRMPM